MTLILKNKPPLKNVDIQRFKNRLIQDGEHLLWTGGTMGKGYGTFWLKGRPYPAHIIAFFIANPNVIYTDITLVLHTCDIKLCCNPEHLYKGTHRDNLRDAYARNSFSMGAPGAKLTREQIIKIRELHKSGLSTRKIAPMFGVGKSTIGAIVNYTSWKHLP